MWAVTSFHLFLDREVKEMGPGAGWLTQGFLSPGPALSKRRRQDHSCPQGSPAVKYTSDGTSLCWDVSASISSLRLPFPKNPPSVIHPWTVTDRTGEDVGAETVTPNLVSSSRYSETTAHPDSLGRGDEVPWITASSA